MFRTVYLLYFAKIIQFDFRYHFYFIFKDIFQNVSYDVGPECSLCYNSAGHGGCSHYDDFIYPEDSTVQDLHLY